MKYKTSNECKTIMDTTTTTTKTDGDNDDTRHDEYKVTTPQTTTVLCSLTKRSSLSFSNTLTRTKLSNNYDDDDDDHDSTDHDDRALMIPSKQKQQQSKEMQNNTIQKMISSSPEDQKFSHRSKHFIVQPTMTMNNTKRIRLTTMTSVSKDATRNINYSSNSKTTAVTATAATAYDDDGNRYEKKDHEKDCITVFDSSCCSDDDDEDSSVDHVPLSTLLESVTTTTSKMFSPQNVSTTITTTTPSRLFQSSSSQKNDNTPKNYRIQSDSNTLNHQDNNDDYDDNEREDKTEYDDNILQFTTGFTSCKDSDVIIGTTADGVGKSSPSAITTTRSIMTTTKMNDVRLDSNTPQQNQIVSKFVGDQNIISTTEKKWESNHNNNKLHSQNSDIIDLLSSDDDDDDDDDDDAENDENEKSLKDPISGSMDGGGRAQQQLQLQLQNYHQHKNQKNNIDFFVNETMDRTSYKDHHDHHVPLSDHPLSKKGVVPVFYSPNRHESVMKSHKSEPKSFSDDDDDDDEENDSNINTEDHDYSNNNNSNNKNLTSILENPLDELNQLLEQNHSESNKDLRTCFICGKSLVHIKKGWNGRVRHIKNCSKKQNITAQDIRHHRSTKDDEEDEEEDFHIPESSGVVIKSSSSTSSNRIQQQNPYTMKNINWHGTAQQELTHAKNQMITTTTTTTSSSSLSTKRTFGGMLKASVNQIGSIVTKTVAPSLNAVLMAGARRKASIDKILTSSTPANQKGRSPLSLPPPGQPWQQQQTQRGTTGSRRSCPTFKKIPLTDFIVDGFQYANETLSSNYFLTHFHSDHYGGIKKSWNFGIIYCSLPTANLVNQLLGVDRKYLHPLPLLVPTIVESNGCPVTVTLLPANHCPGAIMFIFECKNRTVLHVGDFRWNTTLMLGNEMLRSFSTGQRQLDVLFLDTTYCNAKYTLPTQQDCINETIVTAKHEVDMAQKVGQNTLLLFGAYTIGKEAVYMAVAEQLQMKVYVDKRRYRILSALEWTSNQLSMFTTCPNETFLWVVPLGHVNMKKMEPYLSLKIAAGGSSGSSYDRIVGFRPTGWSLKPPTNQKSIISNNKNSTKYLTTTTRGKLTVHSVPYSEHSSFPELVECVHYLQPKRIIPTVSVSKSQEQIDLLLSHSRTMITEKREVTNSK